ncbi:biotin--[acetyl-CoA-carboxylase] ligase [Arcobacter sp. 31_11_sub10_T18]|nr:biotin--[acetyl-CoA-carboxylase] ligase [Arcobacter sp. 31_11_sub10_T18]
MKIIELEVVNSTHIYLRELIRNNGYEEPLAVLTSHQTHGIGSRGNSWTGMKGNLFFSFVLNKEDLPKDLPLQSASIYFSYILKIILKQKKSKLWLKWPNDFYIKDKKIGGTITTTSGELMYCGIGLNLNAVSEDFEYLDIKIDKKEVLKLYFEKLKEKILWKQIFSEYKIEFQNSKKFQATVKNKKVSLNKAILNIDGSIDINGEKVYSLR